MTTPIRDIYRRQSRKDSGKTRYLALREVGYTRLSAARCASISIDYAISLDSQSAERPGQEIPSAESDEAYVATLISLGGFPRLSEKLKREGHVVCLPLLPFEVRP